MRFQIECSKVLLFQRLTGNDVAVQTPIKFIPKHDTTRDCSWSIPAPVNDVSEQSFTAPLKSAFTSDSSLLSGLELLPPGFTTGIYLNFIPNL